MPVATLNRVGADDFSWSVPGLREELVTSLIRSLPKNLRVSFVPAPDRAREFLRTVPPGEEPLLDALERWCRATTGVVVPREAWDWSKVPEHLRPTYRVVDDGGGEQARGKDLEALKAPLRPQFAEALADVAGDAGLTRTGETDWVFGEVPESFTRRRAGHEVTAHPALVDEGGHRRPGGVRLRGRGGGAPPARRPAAARARPARPVRAGPRRPRERREARARGLALRLGRPRCSPTAAAPCSPTPSTTARRCATRPRSGRWSPRSGRGWTTPSARCVADVLVVLERWRAADRALSGRADMAMLPALTDMRSQLARLVTDGFVGDAGARRLRRYPTYLGALAQRRARLDEGRVAVGRDRQLLDQLAAVQEAWLHRVAALPEGRPPGAGLREARWLIEEFRVSLWAQQLGVEGKVSDARIRKVLDRAS